MVQDGVQQTGFTDLSPDVLACVARSVPPSGSGSGSRRLAPLRAACRDGLIAADRVVTRLDIAPHLDGGQLVRLWRRFEGLRDVRVECGGRADADALLGALRELSAHHAALRCLESLDVRAGRRGSQLGLPPRRSSIRWSPSPLPIIALLQLARGLRRVALPAMRVSPTDWAALGGLQALDDVSVGVVVVPAVAAAAAAAAAAAVEGAALTLATLLGLRRLEFADLSRDAADFAACTDTADRVAMLGVLAVCVPGLVRLRIADGGVRMLQAASVTTEVVAALFEALPALASFELPRLWVAGAGDLAVPPALAGRVECW
jgi:hypothetical protein